MKKRSEAQARDSALDLVASGRRNHYQEILDEAEDHLVHDVAPGTLLVADDIFQFVLSVQPLIEPREKRVMGPVLLTLAKKGLIRQCGNTSRGRSHCGKTTHWIRI